MTLEELLSPAKRDEVRRNADNIAIKLSKDQINDYRYLAKTNLYFLSTTVLRYNRLSTDLHGELCNFVADSSHIRLRGFLLPRGHYKSTVLTIAHSIQLALPDDTGKLPWPYNLGPDIRILIGHEIRDSAAAFLSTIQGHFLGNPHLLALYPELLANDRDHVINKTEFELPRKAIHPEKTFSTIGVGGAAQSRHYNWLKLDDLIGEAARESQAEMKSAKDWFDNVESLFSNFTVDHLDLIGTRWAFDDLYSHAKEKYVDMVWFEKGFYKQDENGKKVPIFPAVYDAEGKIDPEKGGFTEESVQGLKKNLKVWNAQYLNNPKDAGTGFEEAWLRYYYWVGLKDFYWFDRTLSERDTLQSRIRYSTSELDICFLIDPGKTGQYGFVVTGMDYRGRIFILDAISRAFKENELMDFLFSKVLFWQPRVVGIEEVLFSVLYQYWIQAEQKLRSQRFKVEPLVTKNKEKGFRISALTQPFSQGTIFINENMVDFTTQYNQFGSIAPDKLHLLDALAHGPQVWRKFSGNVPKEVKEDRVKAILARRNRLTGY